MLELNKMPAEIPLFKPSMGEEEIKAVEGVLKSGWIGQGPKTAEFEKKFAEYIRVKYAVAVNSCTAALHLALEVLGISSGEVIIPAMTFVSTAMAVNYTGARPVFADISEDTLNIDVKDIKSKITSKTKAIIVVHYGGHPCEMDEIIEIAKKYNLKVIEDCAHACGAEYKGKKAGSIGDIGCFSFHAVKNLATGDGGMITLNDEELDKKLRRKRWMGITKDTFQRSENVSDWYYEVNELGYKAHMNDITAAIGLVQLYKLEKMNTRRREIVENYNKAFKNLEWIALPVKKNYVKSSYLNYAVKVKERDALIKYLKEKGISTGVHYTPLNLHKFYKDHTEKVPVAEKVYRNLILFPVFADLTDEQQDYIINSVKKFK